MAAEQLEGGVLCGGKWWMNSSTNLFRSSPCSYSSINVDPAPAAGRCCLFGWLNHDQPIIDDMMKTAAAATARSSSVTVSDHDSAGSAYSEVGSGSIVLLQDHVQLKPSDDEIENVSIASTLQMMGINILSSSSSSDHNSNWNQDLQLHHDDDNIGRSEQDYSNHDHMLQGMTYEQNSSNYKTNFRQENIIQNFPFNSTLLQTLFHDTDSDQSTMTTNYLSSSQINYMNSTEFCPSLLTKDSSVGPSSLFPKQHPDDDDADHLQYFFTNYNDTPPFSWNAAGASNFLPLISQPQLVLPYSSLNSAKPNLHTLTTKQHKQEAAQGCLNSMVTKKVSNDQPPFKRPRIETPSPLPTFKVRKEKLGDRITALQQLVSPFGKTDTASVLHEAIEYIRFLHDQTIVLSSPYLKNVPPQLQHQQGGEKMKDEKEQIIQVDLKSRGLCLVPISSTFPVSANTTDFWSPTFGGCFR